MQGNGVIKRQLGAFNGVSSNRAAKVEIRIGTTEGISIEAGDKLLPLT